MKQVLFVFVCACLFSCKSHTKIVFHEYDFKVSEPNWLSIKPSYQLGAVIETKTRPKYGEQTAGCQYSFIGDTKKALEMFDKVYVEQLPALSQEKIDSFNTYERKNAKETIIAEAKKKDVVIINEAHHVPQHRAFTNSLLQELYDAGYRHFGMESLTISQDMILDILNNKYPSLEDGYYLREPQYGDMVRQAVKIGYKVFGYESQGHSNGKEREINQAKNIQEYIENNRDGKILIHCGYGHASEGNMGEWEKAMAGRLTEFTGIDPLTIDQTEFSEKSKKEFGHPYYNLANVAEPSVFVKDSSFFGNESKERWLDIHVFHPRTDSIGRAKWLLINDRSVFDFKFDSAAIECPCLVFAYPKGEAIGKAVPFDVVETNTYSASLVLGKGVHNIIIWSPEGKALKAEINNPSK